jgi:hypothetical protein
MKALLGVSLIALAAALLVSTEGATSLPTTARTSRGSSDVDHVDERPAAPPHRDEPALSVHDLPEPKKSSRVEGRFRPTPVAPVAPPAVDTLAAEAAFLRAVREDIANGRGSDALHKLDQYRARFGNKGAMGEEASVERVEALFQSGDARSARALGERLLEGHPNGPFARKLRSLLVRQETRAIE